MRSMHNNIVMEYMVAIRYCDEPLFYIGDFTFLDLQQKNGQLVRGPAATK